MIHTSKYHRQQVVSAAEKVPLSIYLFILKKNLRIFMVLEDTAVSPEGCNIQSPPPQNKIKNLFLPKTENKRN